MFVVVQRTDTLPEIRALVNSDHVISIAPVGGGTRSRWSLSNGETWEVAMPFTRALSLLRAELEMVEPVLPVGRPRDFVDRRQDAAPGGAAAPEESHRGYVERRRPPG